jgi:hypothetical protein
VADAKGMRLHSGTTEPGSSGAPCFDDQWRLIAVHLGVYGTSATDLNRSRLIVDIVERVRANGGESHPLIGPALTPKPVALVT